MIVAELINIQNEAKEAEIQVALNRLRFQVARLEDKQRKMRYTMLSELHSSLVFSNGSFLSKRFATSMGHSSASTGIGYNSGRHFWLTRVLWVTDSYLFVGVSDTLDVVKQSGGFPGSKQFKKGVCFCCNNYGLYHAGEDPRHYNTHEVKSGDVVGTLLDMDQKSVQFYVNGECHGTFKDLEDTTYYFILTLYTAGDSIELAFYSDNM